MALSKLLWERLAFFSYRTGLTSMQHTSLHTTWDSLSTIYPYCILTLGHKQLRKQYNVTLKCHIYDSRHKKHTLFSEFSMFVPSFIHMAAEFMKLCHMQMIDICHAIQSNTAIHRSCLDTTCIPRWERNSLKTNYFKAKNTGMHKDGCKWKNET